MATNPFGTGTRPWRRITETLRGAAADVLAKGELAVNDAGRLFIPDGATALKDLVPLPVAADLAAKTNLRDVAQVTSSTTATPDRHHSVTAGAAGVTLTLPTGLAKGRIVSVEKIDGTPAAPLGAVTVSGFFRGSSTASTITLIGPFEAIGFQTDSAGSWWPVWGHKTKSWLDSLYDPAGAAAAVATTASATYATLGQLLTQPTAALTASGTLTLSAPNTIDATTANVTATMPAPVKTGQLLAVERIDATSNTVTLAATAGAAIRGSTTTTITLAGVGAGYEAHLFVAESLSSWRPIGGTKPKAWLDKIYATSAALGSSAYDSNLASPILEQAYASDFSMLAAAQQYSDSQNLTELLRVDNRPGSFGNTNALSTGQSTLDRNGGLLATLGLVSGEMALTYFQSSRTETVNNVRVGTGNTAAGATPTLARVGLFAVAADGSLTLLGSTANTPSLFGSTYVVTTISLSPGVALTAGIRYALGVLVVSAAAMPTVTGVNAAGGILAEANQSPRLCGRVTGLSDLPSTVASGSVATSSRSIYLAVTA